MRWFLDHAVVDALLDDPQSPLERDAAIFDLKIGEASIIGNLH